MGKRSLVALFLLFLLVGCATSSTIPTPTPLNRSMSNDQLWTALMSGNGSYERGSLIYNNLINDRVRTAPPTNSQNPPVTILSCADSRVPPELAFHRTVGDLFVTREAGNVADTFTIASIEYGIFKGYTRVIVVLGHNACGAVEEAIRNVDRTPSINQLIEQIRDSIPNKPCNEWNDAACVNRWVPLNAIGSAKHLIAPDTSPLIRDAVCGKPGTPPSVRLLVASYNLASGKVDPIAFNVPEACQAAAAK